MAMANINDYIKKKKKKLLLMLWPEQSNQRVHSGAPFEMKFDWLPRRFAIKFNLIYLRFASAPSPSTVHFFFFFLYLLSPFHKFIVIIE